jgi:hypothetical protein
MLYLEVDGGPGDPFLLVLDLHSLEHVQAELLLELLVGKVDAQLLERVHLASPIIIIIIIITVIITTSSSTTTIVIIIITIIIIIITSTKSSASHRHALKAEDVEEGNAAQVLLLLVSRNRPRALVHAPHEPIEEPRVQLLPHRITRIGRLPVPGCQDREEYFVVLVY